MADQTPTTQKLHMPYRLREYFLSTPELALFRALQKMIGDRYTICPKVALTDIFTIVRPNENVHFYNKIFRKHVDFLLCDPQTMNAAMGVELIKPASGNETRAIDQFMEDLFLSAGLPLVHIQLSANYDIAELITLFQLAVTKAKGASQNSIRPGQDTVPMCPVCGKMMVLRIQREEGRNGRKYYGCMDSPRCSGIVEIE